MNKVTKYIYNVSKFLAVFLVGIVIWYSTMGVGDYAKYIINDAAVTTTNDTLVSSWIPLNGATNVAIYYGVTDSCWVNGKFEYRYGGMQQVSSGVTDTLSADSQGSATSVSKGKILQGFGLATSLIPGANQVRITLIRRAGSGTTSSVKCAIVYGD